MKHNYLLFSYSSTLKKYKKYFSRLQRHLSKGSFAGLSQSRKNFLVEKVEELRIKLSLLKPKLTYTIAAASLALTLGISESNAQFVGPNLNKNPFPLEIINNGTRWNTPTVGDLDNDGDLDIVVSISEDIFYYENTGTKSAASFQLHNGTTTDNPFGGINPDFDYASMVLDDLDADGDLDLVYGGYNFGTGQQLSYLKNEGTVSSPSFTAQTGTSNPFPITSAYTGYGSSALVDIDGDGDLDAFLVDGYYGVAFFYKNIGSASNPIFEETTSGNPFPTGDLTPNKDDYAFTTFADLDGDGDQDAFIGQYYGEILWYKNTGTTTAAVLSLQTSSNLLPGSELIQWQAPAFADMNDDGTLDLITGEKEYVSINYNNGTNTQPVFTPVGLKEYSNMFFADVDGDGDQDILFSKYSGYSPGSFNEIVFMKNNGPASAPVFVAVTGSANPFDGIESKFTNALADLDGDNDLDFISSSATYYQNTGSATAPIYTSVTGTESPIELINLNNYGPIISVDLDGDLDIDLLNFNDSYGTVTYFKNTGTALVAQYSEQTGTDNPFENLFSTNEANSPTFIDIDKDGDLDLVNGDKNNGIGYYKNIGTSSNPIFSEQTGTNNPFSVVPGSLNSYFKPGFIDIDADGDQDLLVKTNNIGVELYENKEVNVTTPVFSPSASFNGIVKAFPNPVKDVLNVTLSDAIGSTLEIVVLDLKGTEITKQNYFNDGSAMLINVSELNSGFYMLKLSSDSKSSVVKFIKQ